MANSNKTMSLKRATGGSLTCLLLILLQFSASIVLVLSSDGPGTVDDESGGFRMGSGAGTTVKKALGTESPFEAPALDLMGPLPETDGALVDDSIIPKSDTLFNKDTIDPEDFNDMDCHMRNMDLCYAGILGASAKILPETDAELEARCDEMKAMTTCFAVYNQRCSAMKLFSVMMPMGQMSQMRAVIPPAILDSQVPKELSGAKSGSSPIKLIDLMELCEPSAKATKANKELRQRIFQLAKCILPRMQLLRPCLEDLKVAFQLFFEPKRSLPLEPSCCAISRFRHCSREALDGICGLSSFEQLERSFTSGPGGQMMGAVERVCRQRASSYETEYCKDILPARGVKIPERRGRKASKIAKVLDMFSFAPAK